MELGGFGQILDRLIFITQIRDPLMRSHDPLDQ